MLISLCSVKINREIDISYLKLLLESHKNQTKDIELYLGVSCKPFDEKKIAELLETYQVKYLITTESLYFFENLVKLYDFFKLKQDSSLDTWILFSEFGIWHNKRVECYLNCLEGMNNFSPKDKNLIKYIRIPRSIYTVENFTDKDNYTKIDTLLSEGQIICNENSSWGELCEYVTRQDVFQEFTDNIKTNYPDLIARPNCSRYFLKYLNCNEFKFLHLNTEKITIDFWMFFYFYNEPNTYFKPTKNLEIYEDSFESIVKHDLVKQKSVVYNVGSKVTTRLGPGVIENITNNVFKVKIDWEKQHEIVEFDIGELHQYDENESRKNLYVFIANLLNNIELYLTNYVFNSDNPPSYENFSEIISEFVKQGKAKLKSDNLFEKLGTLLDYREKILDEKIYHNNLTKNIFNHVLETPLFNKIKTIEKINNKKI